MRIMVKLVFVCMSFLYYNRCISYLGLFRESLLGGGWIDLIKLIIMM